MNYKGFDKDLKCRGFQYEVGKEYEEKTAKACSKGFHACEYPLDVFVYYPPATSRFCEVEQSGDIDKDGDDTKVASTKIKIGAEIGILDIVKASVDYIKSKVDWENAKESNTGYQSAATNTGNGSVAAVEGKDSVAIVTGRNSNAKGAIGCWLVLTERGEWNGETYPILGIKAVKVDGKKIKAYTFYKLEDGKVVKAE